MGGLVAMMGSLGTAAAGSTAAGAAGATAAGTAAGAAGSSMAGSALTSAVGSAASSAAEGGAEDMINNTISQSTGGAVDMNAETSPQISSPSISDFANKSTGGLFDSSVKSTDQVADHTFGNFVNGYNKAATMGGVRANAMDGNFASAAGGMMRMGEGMPDSTGGSRPGMEQFTKGAWQQPQMQGMGNGGGYQRGINSFRKQQY